MGCIESSEDHQSPGEMKVDEKMLAEFLQLEREVAEAEVSNPSMLLKLKVDQLHLIEDDIHKLDKKMTIIEGNVKEEWADLDLRLIESESDDLKSAIMKLGSSFDNEKAREQEEYFAALNTKEITEKELFTLKKQYQDLSNDIEKLSQQAEVLHNLYKQQEKLLASIFGGDYGSLRENQIEQELDQIESQRSRILDANFKWRQAHMMLDFATKQLAIAEQKWQELPALPAADLEVRYSVAVETRNNVIAAGQNIGGAQRYLEKVEFPYCTPQEVDTLNRAAQYAFTDMQIPDRHAHANQCYNATYKRSNALLQWLNTVINATIMKDLHEVNERVKEKTVELRRERVKLIQSKIVEMFGTEAKLDDTLRGKDYTLHSLATANLNENQVFKVAGLEQIDERAGSPTPLSKSQLAAVPNDSIIFGKNYSNYQAQLSSLKKQHKSELNQFLKEQELTQQKVEGNLEEKLVERRRRRARKKLEKMEKQHLSR